MNLRIFCIILILFAVTACIEDFKIIEAEQLLEQWEKTDIDTAASWWYLGQDDGYHYIVHKWPLKKLKYRVSTEDIMIIMDEPLLLSEGKRNWVNLKQGQIVRNARTR